MLLKVNFHLKCEKKVLNEVLHLAPHSAEDAGLQVLLLLETIHFHCKVYLSSERQSL